MPVEWGVILDGGLIAPAASKRAAAVSGALLGRSVVYRTDPDTEWRTGRRMALMPDPATGEGCPEPGRAAYARHTRAREPACVRCRAWRRYHDMGGYR